MTTRVRAVLGCALTVLVAACSALDTKSNGSPGSYPDVAGTWALTFTYQLAGDSVDTVGATMIMQPVASVVTSDLTYGAVNGTYTFATPYSGGDSVIASLSTYSTTSEGGIDFIEFGDFERPLLFQHVIFAALYPNCNFGGQLTTFTLASGALTATALALQGEYTDVRCFNGTDTVGVVVSANVTGTKTSSSDSAATHLILRR
jgi:hypothetical protein